jgi:hypothetical protein
VDKSKFRSPGQDDRELKEGGRLNKRDSEESRESPDQFRPLTEKVSVPAIGENQKMTTVLSNTKRH